MAVPVQMAPAEEAERPLENGNAEAIYLETDGEPYVMESLCMSCYENGETRMLLTKIPHFRDVMVVSFECSHCGFRNNEIKFTGQFGERGVRYELHVPNGEDHVLSRQLVKSDNATVTVPELDFEIPKTTQKGSISTVEGILSDAAAGLRDTQDQRRALDADVADAVDQFLGRLADCYEGRSDFTLVLDDPAGNSYIESPDGRPDLDDLITVRHYDRTQQQAAEIGLLSAPSEIPESQAQPEIAPDDPHHGHAPRGAVAMHQALGKLQGAAAEALMNRYAAPEEVMEFPGHCSACMAPCTSRMFNVQIPFFKEVILMSDSCDVCGYKNSEVKGTGGIPEQGRKFQLRVDDAADLQRDVLKAETASVTVPELDLEVTTGTLGGIITTVEGLLTKIKEALQETRSFQLGDSADQLTRSLWREFFEKMEQAIQGETKWTLILTDPLDNSFIAPRNGADPESDDAQLVAEYFTRSTEEDAEFGIDHLREHGTGLEAQLEELDTVD